MQWGSPASQASTLPRMALTATTGGKAGTQGAIAQALIAPFVQNPRVGVFDNFGNLYYSSTGNCTIRVYNTTSGTVSIVVGGVANSATGSGVSSGGTTPADGVGTSAKLGTGVAAMAISADQGTLYWAESTIVYSVRQVNLSTGNTSNFVGTGTATYVEGTGTTAGFLAPTAIAIDYARGLMYVGDTGRLRKVVLATRATALVTGTGTAGHVDGPPGTCTINPANAIAVQPVTGNVYVADVSGYNIRVVTPGGVCSTLAGSPAGTGPTLSGAVDGLGTNARINYPRGIIFDNFGSLYITEMQNNKIRKITTCGQVSTLTGAPNVALLTNMNAGNGGPLSGVGMCYPWGLALDARSNTLYVFEAATACAQPVTGATGAVRAITLPSPTLTPSCDGTWHSIQQTYSGGGGSQLVRSFMDGALLSSQVATPDVTGSNSTPIFIGASGESSRQSYFSGAVSDVRVFGRELTRFSFVSGLDFGRAHLAGLFSPGRAPTV